MRLFTKGLVTVAITVSLLLPAITQASQLTTEQINSVIGLLQSFNVDIKTVETVKAVLNNTPSPHLEWKNATSSEDRQKPPMPPGQEGKPSCITLLRDVGPGSTGEDVRMLQHMLADDTASGFAGTTTGYYGPMTAQAMMRFQANNSIASSTSGVVGPLTRGFLERRCGKGLDWNRKEGNRPMMGTTTAGASRPMMNVNGSDR